MKLHDAHKGVTKHKKPNRVGRGLGSGQGKTSGKGHKGQIQRAGWFASPVFQGGQMPLVRRIPKRGFTNAGALKVLTVNIGDVASVFPAGSEVTPQTLADAGLVKGRYDELKVLGDGEVPHSLKVSAHRFSATAKEKIEKAGGTATVIPGRTPVIVKQKAAKEARKAAKAAAKAAGKTGK